VLALAREHVGAIARDHAPRARADDNRSRSPVSLDPVTLRYSGALYNLAQKKGALPAVARDVERLGREIAEPALAGLLDNPRLDTEKKRTALAPVIAGMHVLTQNCVNLLLDKGRVAVLEKLALAFRRRELEERGAVQGIVESVRPLDKADVQRLSVAIGARLGKELLLENVIVPELIGGARVLAANRMVDMSVQGRLDGMRRKLMDATMPPSS
jgi:F-type H+-transporting ATPase subunit delta